MTVFLLQDFVGDTFQSLGTGCEDLCDTMLVEQTFRYRTVCKEQVFRDLMERLVNLFRNDHGYRGGKSFKFGFELA